MVRYKPYERYKDSGVEWIGEIPEHWEMSRLKRVTELVIQKASNDDLDKPYIGLENIESWTGQYNTVEEFEDTSANLFSPGMVLFGKLRPYLAKSIKVNFWGRCSSELLTLDLKKIASCFLHYLLLTKGFISEVNSSTYGVKMPRAGWEFIGNMFMVIPPESEQQAIANFLDQKTSELDGLIADKEKLVTLLQEYRQAIISEAVTKGLNPDAKMKDSGVEWIGEIPEHWEVNRLKYVAEYQVSNVDKIPLDAEQTVRLCNYTDIYNNEFISPKLDLMITTATPIEIRKFGLAAGDVIITKDSEDWRDIAVPALVIESTQDMVCGYHLAMIRSQKLCLLGSYLFRLLQSRKINSQFQVEARGVTRYGIPKNAIGNAVIPIVPIEEQQAIADHLDQKTSEVDDLISGIQESIAQLKSYRQSLISEAVTGKIDVRGVI